MRTLLMENKDKIKFANIMRGFEINCSDKITKEQLDFYFTNLKQFPFSEMELAFKKVLYKWEYNKMPTIGVFIKVLGKSQPLIEDIAEIQATEVLKQMQECGYCNTPKFTDPVTIELMKHRFNFISLCKTMKESEIKWFVKEFIQAYQAFDRNKENSLIGDIPSELKKITNNLFKSV